MGEWCITESIPGRPRTSWASFGRKVIGFLLHECRRPHRRFRPPEELDDHEEPKDEDCDPVPPLELQHSTSQRGIGPAVLVMGPVGQGPGHVGREM